MASCRVCESAIEPFIDFGRMPLANGFLTPAQFPTEYFFQLRAACCQACQHVQLLEQPPRERMFNERYPFFTATSARMTAHFADLARDVITRLPHRDAFVVELGSNDGTLLKHVAQAGIRHLGVEPSSGVAEEARAAGVNTVVTFFDAELATSIVNEYGQADAIIATNALSHVAEPHRVLTGLAQLLSPGGTIIIEDPYWGDLVAQTAFDQIYDEHASYFSVTSMQQLCASHGLTVTDVLPVPVHGGSMRYVISRAGASRSDRVERLLEREHASALHAPATLDAFRGRVAAIGDRLMKQLAEYRSRGWRVVGYGATSKSTTPINYFGITPELIEFISDVTPAKHGTFSPGAHIPVRPHAEFAANYPERALLFLWNHAEEVRSKEQRFADSGGRWLRYVPDVHET